MSHVQTLRHNCRRTLRSWLPYFHYHWVRTRDAAVLRAAPQWPLTRNAKHALTTAGRQSLWTTRSTNADAVGRLGGGRFECTGREQWSFACVQSYSGWPVHPVRVVRALQTARCAGAFDGDAGDDLAWLCALCNVLLAQPGDACLDASQLLSNRVSAALQALMSAAQVDCAVDGGKQQSSVADNLHVLAQFGLASWLRWRGFVFADFLDRPQWLPRDAVAARLLARTLHTAAWPDWRLAFGAGGCYVAPSTVAGAGHGCFARVAVPVGCTVATYVGRRVSARHVEKGDAANAEYTLAVDSSVFVQRARKRRAPVAFVDARDVRLSTCARFINQANCVQQINVLFDEFGHVVTVRPLQPGDELLTTYGEGGAFFQPTPAQPMHSSAPRVGEKRAPSTTAAHMAQSQARPSAALRKRARQFYHCRRRACEQDDWPRVHRFDAGDALSAQLGARKPFHVFFGTAAETQWQFDFVGHNC